MTSDEEDNTRKQQREAAPAVQGAEDVENASEDDLRTSDLLGSWINENVDEDDLRTSDLLESLTDDYVPYHRGEYCSGAHCEERWGHVAIIGTRYACQTCPAPYVQWHNLCSTCLPMFLANDERLENPERAKRHLFRRTGDKSGFIPPALAQLKNFRKNTWQQRCQVAAGYLSLHCVLLRLLLCPLLHLHHLVRPILLGMEGSVSPSIVRRWSDGLDAFYAQNEFHCLGSFAILQAIGGFSLHTMLKQDQLEPIWLWCLWFYLFECSAFTYLIERSMSVEAFGEKLERSGFEWSYQSSFDCLLATQLIQFHVVTELDLHMFVQELESKRKRTRAHNHFVLRYQPDDKQVYWVRPTTSVWIGPSTLDWPLKILLLQLVILLAACRDTALWDLCRLVFRTTSSESYSITSRQSAACALDERTGAALVFMQLTFDPITSVTRGLPRIQLQLTNAVQMDDYTDQTTNASASSSLNETNAPTEFFVVQDSWPSSLYVRLDHISDHTATSLSNSTLTLQLQDSVSLWSGTFVLPHWNCSDAEQLGMMMGDQVYPGLDRHRRHGPTSFDEDLYLALFIVGMVVPVVVFVVGKTIRITKTLKAIKGLWDGFDRLTSDGLFVYEVRRLLPIDFAILKNCWAWFQLRRDLQQATKYNLQWIQSLVNLIVVQYIVSALGILWTGWTTTTPTTWFQCLLVLWVLTLDVMYMILVHFPQINESQRNHGDVLVSRIIGLQDQRTKLRAMKPIDKELMKRIDILDLAIATLMAFVQLIGSGARLPSPDEEDDDENLQAPVVGLCLFGWPCTFAVSFGLGTLGALTLLTLVIAPIQLV